MQDKYKIAKELTEEPDSPMKRMAAIKAKRAHDVAVRTVLADAETEEYEANVALVLAKRVQEEAKLQASVARLMFRQ